MQSKNPNSVTFQIKDKQAYKVKFMRGSKDMKELFNELIACRIGKKYEH